MAEIRFSTRRAAKVTNYNENDEDPFSEEDTENMTPNYWITAAGDESPAIDQVVNHRMKEGSSELCHCNSLVTLADGSCSRLVQP